MRKFAAAILSSARSYPTARFEYRMDLYTFLEDQARMVSLVANHWIMCDAHDGCRTKMRIIDHLVAVEHDLKEAAARVKKKTWKI